jgi:hypothetical protein
VFAVDLNTNSYQVEDNAYIRAQRALSPALRAAHNLTGDWAKLENPVIDYFRAPMTYLSPAPALAEGYFANFVLPVVTALTLHRANEYFYDIGWAPVDPKTPRQTDDFELIHAAQRESLDLQIIVPDRIEWAKHDYADELRGVLHPAVVHGDGRSFTLWAHETRNGRLHLIDIPTTMRGAEKAVDRRMRFPVSRDHADWREVEDQEIQRFVMMLQSNIQTEFSSERKRQKVRVRRSNELRSDWELAWLDEILRRD